MASDLPVPAAHVLATACRRAWGIRAISLSRSARSLLSAQPVVLVVEHAGMKHALVTSAAVRSTGV